MDFDILKRIHLRSITVILKSGEGYHGIIVSHAFIDSTMIIERISLLTDKDVVRIDCGDIKAIIDTDSKQEYLLAP